MNDRRLALGESEVCFPLRPELAWEEWQAVDLEAGEPLSEIGPALRRELERTRSNWDRQGAETDAAIVVPDLTRPAPLDEFLEPLLVALEEAGVDRGRCRLIVAAGTHQRPTREELWESWGCGRDLKLVIHDADAPGVRLGSTPAGTPVELDPEYVNAALRITVGAVSFHYFAGFGGGPKLVFPGLAARHCVRVNHRRALAPLPPGGLSAGCAPGVIEGNPVAWDIAAAAAKCAAHVGVHLLRCGAGWRGFVGQEGLLEARRTLLRRGARGPARAYDVVIASAGGAPHDVDLVQAHKALLHASRYAREGAAIVLLAATPRGPGSESFARWLETEDLADLERRARDHYELNAQTAISIRTLVRRFRVIWLGSSTPEWVARAGATAVENPEEAWEQVERVGMPGDAKRRGAVLPDAATVIPVEPWGGEELR
jgi:nickel-dependent lactate racemase